MKNCKKKGQGKKADDDLQLVKPSISDKLENHDTITN